MSLSNPSALLWFALAAPIILLYILKLRLRRVRVSTSMFWQRIFEDKRPRSIWQRLRHLWSLLLQLLFLSLLVLAIANPTMPWERNEGQRLVIIVDNSASMNAQDGAPTRLDAARKAALGVVQRMKGRDLLAVILGGEQAIDLTGLTDHERTLRDAVLKIAPTDGPDGVSTAVAKARRLLAGHPEGRIVVISDGGFEGAEELSKAKDVRLLKVGRATNNVGITRFQVRRSSVDVLGYEVLLEATNFGDQEARPRLELELEGLPVDVIPLTLAPGQKWSQVFDRTSERGGRILATLAGHSDAFPTDDVARGILPKRDPIPISIVTPGNHFLERVFQANRLTRPRVVPTMVEEPTKGSVTVYHQRVPAILPNGWLLIIDPKTSCDLFKVSEPVPSPLVTKIDKASPLMASVQLENVYLPDARQLEVTGDPRVLASGIEGHPLLLAWETLERKVIVLTADLDRGDLPLRTAFPIFIANTLAWFTGNAGELRESVATGATRQVPVPGAKSFGPPDTRSWRLRAPSGRTRPAKVERGAATVGPLYEAGWWTLEPTGEGLSPLEVACNLTNPRESDLSSQGDLAGDTDAAEFRGGFFGWFAAQPLWRILAILAFFLTTVEWCLYQRRVVA